MIASREIALPQHSDERGILLSCECPNDLPFSARRFFVVLGRQGVSRGGHAHRTCHQLLVGISGVIEVEVEDDLGIRHFVLDDPQMALYIPPFAWSQQHYASTSARLLVLASHEYDRQDYIDSRELATWHRSSIEGNPGDVRTSRRAR